MHGWTWRELMRDRPSISIPDDHDVYQGNIWGEGGAPRHGTQETGGYDMPPPWVNVVHRTQTSHHPDPYDPTPIKQGIDVYYGPLTYGRMSFAMLADRSSRPAPKGVVPPTAAAAIIWSTRTSIRRPPTCLAQLCSATVSCEFLRTGRPTGTGPT